MAILRGSRILVVINYRIWRHWLSSTCFDLPPTLTHSHWDR